VVDDVDDEWAVMMRSCPAQAGELRFEQSPDLFVAEIARAQTFDRRGDDRLTGAERVRGVLRASRARHERACAVPQLDHAFVFELAIRFRNGVRVDDELLRERADARQLLTLAERAGLDGVLDLLHQLKVNGRA
jgi:hypothetical protein